MRLAVRWMREKGLLLRVFAPAPPGAGATVCGSSRGLIECRILRLDQRTPSWRPPSGPRARRACPSLMRPAVSARRRERCQNSHVCRNCRGETPLSRTNASARRNDFSNRICRNFRDLQLARRQQKFWRALASTQWRSLRTVRSFSIGSARFLIKRAVGCALRWGEKMLSSRS